MIYFPDPSLAFGATSVLDRLPNESDASYAFRLKHSQAEDEYQRRAIDEMLAAEPANCEPI